jgi:hypothetical protein
MGTLIQNFVADRRVERRFRFSGTATMVCAGQAYESHIEDISLNGVMLSAAQGLSVRPGDRMVVKLQISASETVQASIVVVYADAMRVGCEFYDMEQSDFSRLNHLIQSLY